MKKVYRGIYKVFKVILTPIIARKFNATFESVKPESPVYVVLSNHNTDWDPILVGLSFSRPMTYVTSEHVFRQPVTGWLIKTLLDPISRSKGTTEARTALEMIKRLRNGDPVCMFAEGNRSFNGRTCPILPSTGKLIKKSGAGLITYRMHGGYFTSPRWSRSLRKGRITGAPVHEYTAEALAAMSVDEVNAAIATDLQVDAYEEQAREPVAYMGKALAEGLESTLYMCPKCGSIGTMTSKGDFMTCTCGMSVRYDEFGRISGDSPFPTVTEWDDWQKAEMAAKKPHISDENQPLLLVSRDHTDEDEGRVTIAMDAEALTVGGKAYPTAEVLNMSIITQNTLVFSTADKSYYELPLTGNRSAKKYLDLFETLRA